MASPGEWLQAPERMLNLGKYPIHDAQSEGYKNLVALCQKQLLDDGACELPGFVRPEVIADMCREADTLAAVGFHSTVVGNAYLEPIDPSLPDDHPKKMTETTALAAVAYDQIPRDSLVRALYEWEPLMQFLAAALDVPKLYRYADPMGALNISVMRDGDYLRWHFDQTDFVTSIAIQVPESGGEFEYVPRIRQAGNENFNAVRSLLKGSTAGVKTIANVPGTLLLFQGRYSIHRVTPIHGKRLRHMALLGYDTKPGVTSSEHLQNMRYGRVAKS